MNTDTSSQLIYVYENIDLVLLIFLRILGGIYLIPIFSNLSAPARVKIGFSFMIAVLVFSTGTIPIVEYNTFIQFLIIAIKELITGITISFVIYVFFTIFYFVGHMIDTQIGFAMANVFDPVTNMSVAISGNLIFYAMVAFLIQSNGINYLIYAIFNSYEFVPINTAVFINNEFLASYFIYLLSSYFYIGLSISMPIVGCIFIVNVSLGLLVKAAPQMNVFVVGMPIKLLIGLILLGLFAPMYGEVYRVFFDQLMNALETLLKGM